MDAEEEALKDVSVEIEGRRSTEGMALPNVCLPHLCQLIFQIDNEGAKKELLLHEARILDQLAESMQRFALKHEGLSIHLAKEEERKAPKQALMLLVGHPNTRIEAPR